MTQNIKFYNTLSKSKEIFKPIIKDTVKIYSCGPTVYSDPHIGNMRAYVFSDLLKRTLLDYGYTVEHVINITDVGHLTSDADDGEDKLEKASKKENLSAYEIAKHYKNIFFKDLNSLNILPADHYPRATDTIQEQIDMVKILIDKGYAYKISDGIYFDTSKYDDYNKLANLDLEGLEAGERVNFNTEKRNKSDFALWKFSNPSDNRQMEWDSPFGIGFPGWHIECSAMAKQFLGNHIDIHTGGIDHIPVHHTNEKAQSEVCNEHKFVNYWMHVNFLNTKDKMSKSKGNTITINDLKKEGYSYNVIKLFYLMTHYRSEINFSLENLDHAKNRYKKLKNKVTDIRSKLIYHDNKYILNLKKELYDDLNTSNMINLFSQYLVDDTISIEDKQNIISFFIKVTGIDFKENNLNKISDDIIQQLKKRENAKENKDYKLADSIRDNLIKDNFIILDNKNNVTVQKNGYYDFVLNKI